MRFDETVGILCIDDDEIDIMSLKRSFSKLGFSNPLYTATNGAEALELLRGEKGLDPRPQIVLLDLNMPKMNGHEFLEQVRADPSLHTLTIIVLTTSALDSDIMSAFQHYVAGYLVKPPSAQGLREALGKLATSWDVMNFPPPFTGEVS